jgi:3-oxoadipate enol-lactonase
MPFAELSDRGIRLYYELRGAGPPLTYLGGTGGDLRRAPNALEVMLAKHFRVLMLDQRGMGRSGKPDVPYAMADYAEDAAALLDHVGWARCPVLGYSFGGMVAQELALRHPERLERLVLLSTTAGGAGGASYPLHELSDLTPEQLALRMVELGDRRRGARWRAEHPGMQRALADEALVALRLGAEEPGHAIGARRQIEARRMHDTWERLPGLRLPVWVFGGRYDGIAAPEAVERLAGRIPGAKLEFFEGGHLFYLQDARALERIREVLSAS